MFEGQSEQGRGRRRDLPVIYLTQIDALCNTRPEHDEHSAHPVLVRQEAVRTAPAAGGDDSLGRAVC